MRTITTPVLFTALLLLLAGQLQAQSKADKKVIKQLQEDIGYLASDELKGRRTGSEGEKKAADYIIGRYETLKVPAYNKQFRYPFSFVYGKAMGENTIIRLGSSTLKLGTEAFPLPFSANKKVTAEVLPDVQEQGNTWLIPLFASADEANDPHFDWEKKAFEHAKDATKQGANGVIFFDSYNSKFPPSFNPHSEYESIAIPAVVISYDTWRLQMGNGNDNKGVLVVELNINLNKPQRTGTNIAAFIDNHAPLTVILGAHYDHLGMGEDGSSLYAGKEPEIHNGADDNASGTAALLQLAAYLKKSKLKQYNYLFVHFSGEELGLLGSKAFIKEAGIDSSHIAYMINMDMVGRLNDSTHSLTLGGIGTSPSWAEVVKMGNKDFKITVDSAGIGPSDHTSFYNQGIPVLFFFTGSHHDYHKPTDDADKINYPGETAVIHFIEDVMALFNIAPRPHFTATRQSALGRVKFKITLGIMPDYSYQEQGVRVDGVSEGKPASKAGIKTGDIITGLGSDKVMGMQSYMEALSHLKDGQKTKVTILRNGKELKLPIEFK